MPRDRLGPGYQRGVFGAKWWEALGALGVLAAIFFSVKAAFFTEVPSVPPSDIDYPAVNKSPKCGGKWIYTEYQLCEDQTLPIIDPITDAEICGTEIKNISNKSDQFAKCRHESHGIAGYENAETFDEWSGWKKGGYNRSTWCSVVETKARSQIGVPIQWEVIRTDERSKEELIRRFFYKYYCKGEARWNPIYMEARSAACGKEPDITETIEVAKTCHNPESSIRYGSTRRKGCGIASEKIFENDSVKLEERISKEEVSWYACSSCEGLKSDRNNYAECLISSAYYFMEASDTDGMTDIIPRLVALKSNPSSLDRRIKKRIRSQLFHLNEAVD